MFRPVPEALFPLATTLSFNLPRFLQCGINNNSSDPLAHNGLEQRRSGLRVHRGRTSWRGMPLARVLH